MKKFTLPLFAVLFLISASVTTICAQKKTNRAKLSDKKEIVGIWMYRGIVFHDNGQGIGDGQYRPTSGHTFKIISSDGTFTLMSVFSDKAIITGSGKYKMPNDTTFIEQIDVHLNSTMVGKENKLEVHFSTDGSAMSSKFLLEQLATGMQVNVTNTEYWERVETPNPMKKPSKLNPKQKIDGMTEDDLESVQTEPQDAPKDRGKDRKTKIS